MLTPATVSQRRAESCSSRSVPAAPQPRGTKPRGKQPGRHRNCDNHAAGLSPAPPPPEALGQGGRQQCQPAPTTSQSQALASPECPVAHRGQLCLCSGKGTQHKANPPTTAFSAAGGTEAESGPAAQPSPAAGATGSHRGPGAAECAAAEQSQRGHARRTPKSERTAATGEGKVGQDRDAASAPDPSPASRRGSATANDPPCPTVLLAGAGHGEPPGRAGQNPAREHQAGG